jgi:hypothetical protein
LGESRSISIVPLHWNDRDVGAAGAIAAHGEHKSPGGSRPDRRWSAAGPPLVRRWIALDRGWSAAESALARIAERGATPL